MGRKPSCRKLQAKKSVKPPTPLDEKGVLSMFTIDEIEEMRSELAKRSKRLKKKLIDD